MKKPAVTAWQELAGMGPGGVIGAALQVVRLVDPKALAVALDELDRAFYVGQGLDPDRQPDDDRLRFYRSTRRILTTLAELRRAIEPGA